MKLLTAILISLVAGQANLVENVVTVQLFAQDASYYDDNSTKVFESCKNFNCVPKTKPDGKMVYAGLPFTETLATQLPVAVELGSYTKKSNKGTVKAFDGVHFFIVDGQPCFDLVEYFWLGNDFDKLPVERVITIPYSHDTYFATAVAEALKNFKTVFVTFDDNSEIPEVNFTGSTNISKIVFVFKGEISNFCLPAWAKKIKFVSESKESDRKHHSFGYSSVSFAKEICQTPRHDDLSIANAKKNYEYYQKLAQSTRKAAEESTVVGSPAEDEAIKAQSNLEQARNAYHVLLAAKNGDEN